MGLVVLATTGCTHTYIFAGERPPKIEARQLVVELPGEVPERYGVKRVLVAPLHEPPRLPTSAEIHAWELGDSTPELDIVRVDVDVSGAIWRHWVLPSFAIGVGVVILTVAGSGVVEPENSNGLTLSLTALIAVALGLESAGVGAGLGAMGEGGTTDMRFPGGASIGPSGLLWQ